MGGGDYLQCIHLVNNSNFYFLKKGGYPSWHEPTIECHRVVIVIYLLNNVEIALQGVAETPRGGVVVSIVKGNLR